MTSVFQTALAAMAFTTTVLSGADTLAASYLKKTDYQKLCKGKSPTDHVTREELAKILVERANISFDILASLNAPFDSVKRGDFELLMVDPCYGPMGNNANCKAASEKPEDIRDSLQREVVALSQHFRSPAERKDIYFGLTQQLIDEANPNDQRTVIDDTFAKRLFLCERNSATGACNTDAHNPEKVKYAYPETDYAVTCANPPEKPNTGETPTAGGPTSTSGNKKNSKPLIALSDLRIRGKRADLSKDKLKSNKISAGGKDKKSELARFKSLTAAKISLRHDEEADKDTFAIKGAVGLPINLAALSALEAKINERKQKAYAADPSSGKAEYQDDKLSLMAFTEYERSQTSGDDSSSDIHAVSPGLELFFDRPGFAEIAIDAKYTADLAQKSKKLVGDVSLSRKFEAISFWRSKYAPVDNYFPHRDVFDPESGVYVVPSLQARLEASDILNPGMDMKLANAKSYYGVGGKAEMSIGAYTPGILKNFTAGASIEHLEFIAGGIALDSATRFSANLRYAPPGAEHLFLQFEYANGENFKTFQKEEYFDISLGVRY